MKIYNYENLSLKKPSINLKSDIFYFSFGFKFLNGTGFVDETIYYPKLFYYEQINKNSKNVDIIIKQLEVEKCNITKFIPKYHILLKNNDLSNNYYLKNIEDMKLIGNNGYYEMSSIKIIFYPCINTTNNNNYCKSRDIIDKYLTNSYLSFHLQNIEILSNNYENPIIPIIKNIHTDFGKGIFKQLFIYFKIVEIENDINLFFQKKT